MKLFNRIFSDPFAWFASFWLILLSLLTVCEIAKAQSPNLTPKATLPAEQPVRVRAIVAKMHTTVTLPCIAVSPTQNCADKTLDANTGYRVIIGNDLYWTSGVGPSSGIYEAELYQNYIHLNVFHSGVKPMDVYHLHIELIQHDQAESRLAPSTPQPEIVDGRRLIVYDMAPVGEGNTTYRAVAVDRATGKETYFIFSAFTNVLPGIYDFKLVTVEHQTYLDLLTNPKGAGPTWIRFGVSASCEACDPVDPMFAKQNYR
jgi:hypothetical protein